MNYAEKIQSLKLILPLPPNPAGSYQPVIYAGRLAFLSGQVSKSSDGKILTGKVGLDLTLEEGKEAACLAALNVLSIIQNLVGFNRFEKIVRVVGYVQSAPNFYDISQVVNGASDLFIEVFGDHGAHARSSLGMTSLPLNAAVELEVTLETR